MFTSFLSRGVGRVAAAEIDAHLPACKSRNPDPASALKKLQRLRRHPLISSRKRRFSICIATGQLAFIAEQVVPLCYKGVILESAYRFDLLVEDQIVVEVEAIEVVLPVHEAQLLSYLRLMNKPLGLLINFNVPLLTDGVTRKMNGFRVPALHTKEPKTDAPGPQK